MSATKLTLRIDAALIKRAKIYSRKTGKSISQIVADYFAFLNGKSSQEIPPLPPITRSLKGLLRGTKITEEDYKKHFITSLLKQSEIRKHNLQYMLY